MFGESAKPLSYLAIFAQRLRPELDRNVDFVVAGNRGLLE